MRNRQNSSLSTVGSCAAKPFSPIIVRGSSRASCFCPGLVWQMSTAIRPDILRHICKEPLAEVETLQLRGRGIERLIGLGVCLNLTSLDLSWNAVRDLDEACLEECKELWIIDASHNRLVSFLWAGRCCSTRL